MFFAFWRSPQGKRAALAVAATLIGAFFLLSTTDAEARKKRARHTGAWQAGFASIVVDAKTGEILDDENADALRHPASLTKIMTLYLLFEQIEQGKLSLKSRLEVSEYASERPPTKLGLKEGTTIAVEDAIKALITRSANDVATVIAENIAGDEEKFAALMTQKARALGMAKTVFKNASGLPHREQITTARDMATLGRAIQDRFPSLYRFFSTRSFVWRGRVIANHNRLLGRVAGVDGIKTGYTNASGFNLVTSVRHKNRHIVAVVLGGRTGASRDHYMRELISDNLDDASPGKRTAPLVVEAPAPKPQRVAQAQRPAQKAKAQKNDDDDDDDKPRTARTQQPKQRNVVVAGSNEPIRPIAVKTMPVDAEGKVQKTASASLFALPFSNFSIAHAVPMPMKENGDQRTVVVAENAPETPAEAQAEVINNEAKPQPLAEDNAPQTASATPELSETEELEIEARVLAAVRSEKKDDALPLSPAAKTQLRKHQIASTASIPAAVAQTAANHEDNGDPLPPAAKTGWSIQIGAFPDAKHARERLNEAKETETELLARASAYTEKVSKGSNNLFRARFAGFQTEWQARRACQTLQRSRFDCIVAKN